MRKGGLVMHGQMIHNLANTLKDSPDLRIDKDGKFQFDFLDSESA